MPVQGKGSEAVLNVQMGKAAGKTAAKSLAQGFPYGPQAQKMRFGRRRGKHFDVFFLPKDRLCYALKARRRSGRLDVYATVSAASHKDGYMGPGMRETETQAAQALRRGLWEKKTRFPVFAPGEAPGTRLDLRAVLTECESQKGMGCSVEDAVPGKAKFPCLSKLACVE